VYNNYTKFNFPIRIVIHEKYLKFVSKKLGQLFGVGIFAHLCNPMKME